MQRGQTITIVAEELISNKEVICPTCSVCLANVIKMAAKHSGLVFSTYFGVLKMLSLTEKKGTTNFVKKALYSQFMRYLGQNLPCLWLKLDFSLSGVENEGGGPEA